MRVGKLTITINQTKMGKLRGWGLGFSLSKYGLTLHCGGWELSAWTKRADPPRPVGLSSWAGKKKSL